MDSITDVFLPRKPPGGIFFTKQNQNKAYLMKNKILNDSRQCKIHRQIKMFILHYQVRTLHFLHHPIFLLTL